MPSPAAAAQSRTLLPVEWRVYVVPQQLFPTIPGSKLEAARVEQGDLKIVRSIVQNVSMWAFSPEKLHDLA